MMREPAKIQVVGGISRLLLISRISRHAGSVTSLPFFSNRTDNDSGGPWGGSHLPSDSLKCTGSPGLSPSISSAACRCEGRTLDRSTDSYSLVPVTHRKNSSGFSQRSASHSTRTCFARASTSRKGNRPTAGCVAAAGGDASGCAIELHAGTNDAINDVINASRMAMIVPL